MATLGIDFGSTYSMLSHYDEVRDDVLGIQQENGSVYIPSVACISEFGNLLIGQEARDEMLIDPTLTPYRAFKMLLHETKPDKYREHGYIKNTPVDISTKFLRKYVDIAAEKCGVQQFDKAVICVPQHWTHDYNRMNGRAILLDICRKLERNHSPILKDIRVVAEPVAATAYYAYNYWLSHNRQPFQGKVIVVDYGGGTLDVTLTTVTARTDSNSSSTMEIDINYGTGGGQNHPGRIGNAGLAYMEQVTRVALEAAGFPHAEIDGNFLRVRDKLESALIHNTLALEDRIFQKHCNKLERMKTDHEVFTQTAYKHKRIDITYAMLYDTFDKLIRPMLEKYLNELRQPLEDLGSSLDREDTDVKLAIVGGFGQFPLVRKTIWNILQYSNTALDITLDAKGGSRDAVSFGAALIAAGKITVPVKSTYSIGLRSTTVSNKETFRFALNHGQEIDCSKVYPMRYGHEDDHSTGNPPDDLWEPYSYHESDNPQNIPWVFAVSDNDDPYHAIRMTPRPEVIRELNEKMRNAAAVFQAQMRMKGYTKVIPPIYYFGLSMDESEIYTLYIFPRDPITRKRIEEPILKESLGNFPALFGSLISFQPAQEHILTYLK